MSYTILNNDGSTLAIISDSTIDNETTSLTLIGKNWIGYGQYWNQNLIYLLGNFASPPATAPVSPIQGQLWYDSAGKKLNIYDGYFKPINGALSYANQPTDLTEGDLWWNSSNNQLNLYSNNTLWTAGPWNVAVDSKVYNVSNSGTLPVTVIQSNNNIVGYFSSVAAPIGNLNTTSAFLSSQTTSTVNGLTILGDIYSTGTLTVSGGVNVGGSVVLRVSPPAHNTSTGVAGQIAFGSTGTSSTYLYVCTATNSWARIHITDFGPW